MKKIFSQIVFAFILTPLIAQIPPGYYNSAAGLSGSALQLALHNIIDNHNTVSYSSLWTHFQTTDKKANGKVWDMYSDAPGSTPPYEFTFVSDQCGSYGGEGDCYNREHSWPQSWFNSATIPTSDLFHLYPTDGYVNNKRNNYPYGTVGVASWTSQNGSKLGTCIDPGYSSVVFEPIDEYKGDFARTYFYMSTRYLTEDASWSTSGGTNKSVLLPWEASVLLNWSHNDTVSAKEIARTNEVHDIQNNRNPFIDHPEWADSIWTIIVAGIDEKLLPTFEVNVYPNPASDNFTLSNEGNINLKVNIKVMNALGQMIKEITSAELIAFESTAYTIDCSLWEPGIYQLLLIDKTQAKTIRLIKI
jgi:endonuclease I